MDRVSYDEMTVDELIAAALDEEDEYWQCLSELHNRATQNVFQAAKELCKSDWSLERKLGADILAQLRTPEKPFAHESVDFLLDMLVKEEDEDVLDSVITALGHLEDPRAVEPIAQFRNHSNEQIRETVSDSISHYDNELAIDTLIELSADKVRDVRDSATFNIALKEEIDNPQVRDALWKRADDEDAKIRSEALLGLASRKDARVVELLMRELTAEHEDWQHYLDAAKEIADPRLYPALINLRSSKDIDVSLLEDAIDVCRGDNIEDESQVVWRSIERLSPDDFSAVFNNTLKGQFCIDVSISSYQELAWLSLQFCENALAENCKTVKLHTWSAYWSISNKSHIISSRDFREVGEDRADCFVGHKVADLRLTPKLKMLKISFDNGLLLKVSPFISANSKHDDAWTFFSYDTQEISMWCNGMIYRDREFSEEDSTEENGG